MKARMGRKFRCSSFVTNLRNSMGPHQQSSTVSLPMRVGSICFVTQVFFGSGYGGFSISIDPFFSPTILTFLQTYGAILAVPSIRGGSEFGEDWHLAGTREKKVILVHRILSLTLSHGVFFRGTCSMILLLQRGWLSQVNPDVNSIFFVSEYLVKNKYAGAGKVVINGGSNGGQASMCSRVILVPYTLSW